MLGPLTSSSMQGVEPVLRTYNTLIIACNMCNQPREAMAVYKRMLDEGYTPNATTYNALISAHGKAGQLDKVIHSCLITAYCYSKTALEQACLGSPSIHITTCRSDIQEWPTSPRRT